MSNRGISGNFVSAAVLCAGIAIMTATAHAQAVGDPAPVPEKQGLLGTYYSYPVNSTTPPGSTLTSPVTPHQNPQTLLGEQLDPIINIDFVANKPALNGGSSDWFMVEWTGRLVVTSADTYSFFVSSDDGERFWITNTAATTPNLNFWNQRGVVTDTLNGVVLAAGKVDIRQEYEQGNGGASIKLEWQAPSVTRAVIPTANLLPPPGPAAPTLTATSPIAPPPPQVTLTWNQPAGATGYIISRQITAPPANVAPMQVLAIINSGATLTYQDNAVAFGNTYNYIIQATSHTSVCIGPASNTQTVTPTLPAITVFPNTGLQTNENGASTTSTITFNQALLAGQSVTFTITSSRPSEGIVSCSGQGPAGMITFTVNGPVAAGSTIPLTITGVDDAIVDGPQAYTVSVVTSGQFGAVTIPNLQCTNNDNDVAGVTVSPTAGLITTESGGQATFNVVLNTQPTNTVTITLTSSNTLEGTVLPTSLQFTTTTGQAYSASNGIGGWNVSHTVTVTGVDDTVLDFTQYYTIITSNASSTDPNYNNMVVPDVSCANLDNEVPPALPHVWGNGCGLMGAEIALPWLLALLLRPRRKI